MGASEHESVNPLTTAFTCCALLFSGSITTAAFAGDRVKTANGAVESTAAPKDGVRSFKGIPFAKPPVGALRWREPQPVENWTGVRNADQFGPRCMQMTNANSDYWFRSKTMSEDCLYLNIWTPAKSDKEKLPVLVYIYGGGFSNGDGSEPRYDGENMARKGMVAVTLNYRLNVFGFLAHPELSAESAHHASGNYGLLDQAAALRWVQKNIAAFGGDPRRVTIAGESAGSISVSALMASPLSRNLIAGAIGESGALTSQSRPLADTEKDGVRFAELAGAASLAALRAMSAETIQEMRSKLAPGGPGGAGLRFWPNIDGYFLPKPLTDIFEAGEQAKVPLLAGSNSMEQSARLILGPAEPTEENFAAGVQKLYGDNAGEVLKVYRGSTTSEVMHAATDLASARFISQGTWKWTELQMRTGGKPVYRYLYTRIRPKYLGMPGQPAPTPRNDGQPSPPPLGAVHSAEIQYAMGNLDLDKRYTWEPDDYKVSEIMQSYFVNFIKSGNPNGPGMPQWPVYEPKDNYMRMRIDVAAKAEPESDRARYQVLDTILAKRQ
jgi:para-nitrobenzyl esterase